jgi:hypothetical protein
LNHAVKNGGNTNVCGKCIIPCKPSFAPRSAHLKLLFLGSTPLHVSTVCSSQLVPNGACCFSLRACETFSSALGRTCPSCGLGCCSGLHHTASLDFLSLFVTPALSLLNPDGRHAVRPISSSWSRLYATVQPLGTRWM